MVARAVHSTVRYGVANPEFVCRTKDWFEAARHLGKKNIYDVWPVAVDAIHGTGTFVNSWGRRFLDISMGTSQDASCMQSYFGVIQNLMVEIPRCRSKSDSTIYVALPPERVKRFVALGDNERHQLDSMFPFTVVREE